MKLEATSGVKEPNHEKQEDQSVQNLGPTGHVVVLPTQGISDIGVCHSLPLAPFIVVKFWQAMFRCVMIVDPVNYSFQCFQVGIHAFEVGSRAIRYLADQ